MLSGYSLAPGIHNIYLTEFGSVSETCRNMGGPYNPAGEDTVTYWSDQKRIGDLTQLEVGENSSAVYEHIDSKTTLFGEQSIIGRGIVITANDYDLKSK